MTKILVSLVATYVLVPFVGALPYGVVGCGAGKEAVVTNFKIANYTQVGGGPLSDYNLTIKIDDEVLNPNTPFDFEAFKDHKLTLAAQGEPFSGFLLRMEGSNDGFTVDAILPIETLDPVTKTTNSGGAKEVYICKQAYFVAGVSHDSPVKKSVVEMILNMGSVTSNLILDVSVIAESSVGQNFSEWYFSAYTLNAVEGAIDTPPPTVSPVRSTETPTPEVSGTSTQSGAMMMSPIYLSTSALGVGLLLGP